jgi:hypothetical protein
LLANLQQDVFSKEGKYLVKVVQNVKVASGGAI